MANTKSTQERNRESQRKWLAKMSDEERKAFFRAKYYKHKERYNKQSRQWAVDNRSKSQASAHQATIRKRYPEQFAISEIATPELAVWLDQHRGSACAYCGLPGTHIDHITPLALGGQHSWANICLACEKCNLMKSKHTVEEWMNHIRLIVQHSGM